RTGRGGELFGLLFAPALPLALEPQLIERAVARQRQEPGQKGAARAVVVPRVAPQLEKDILYHFFGGRSLLQDAQNQTIDDAGMAVGEVLKSAHVPLQKPLYQRRVRRHSARFRGGEDRKEHVGASSSPTRYTANPGLRMCRGKQPGGSRVVADSNLFGNRKGVFDQGCGGRTLHVVAGEPKSGQAPESVAQFPEALAVTEIVLRDRALVGGDVVLYRRAADSEDG